MSHKSSKLSLSKQLISVDINTTFLAHYDITANDVLRGVTPTADVSTLRPIEGYYGGGIAIEEGTTNVVTNTNLDTGWSKAYCKDIVWNDIAPPVGVESNVVSFVDADIGGNAYWYCYGDYAPKEQGQIYTASLYVRTLDSNFRVRFYTADNSEVGRYSSEYIHVPNDGEWHRVVWNSFTNPIDSMSSSLSYHFTFGNEGESQRTWFCAPQLEKKSFATSFVVGTRENGLLEYPENIINFAQGTFSCWAKSSVIGSIRYIFKQWDTTGGGASHFSLYMGNDGKIFFEYGTETIVSQVGYDDGMWHNYCVSWIDGTDKIHLYVDGLLVGSSLNIKAMQNIGGRKHGTIPIGHRGWTYRDYWWNGIIDEVRIDGIARSSEEIESWYISQLPFYPKGIYRLAY